MAFIDDKNIFVGENLGVAAGQLDDQSGQVDDRDRLRIAEFDKARFIRIHEPNQGLDHVVNVAEGIELPASVPDAERFAGQGFVNEHRDDPRVIQPHPGSVDASKPCNLGSAIEAKIFPIPLAVDVGRHPWAISQNFHAG